MKGEGRKKRKKKNLNLNLKKKVQIYVPRRARELHLTRCEAHLFSSRWGPLHCQKPHFAVEHHPFYLFTLSPPDHLSFSHKTMIPTIGDSLRKTTIFWIHASFLYELFGYITILCPSQKHRNSSDRNAQISITSPQCT